VIAKKIQDEICVWEQTEKHLQKGIEDLTAHFKREIEILADDVLLLGDLMGGKPDFSKTRFGKSRNIHTVYSIYSYVFYKDGRVFRRRYLVKC